MHGLIFKTSIYDWQDQPDSYGRSVCAVGCAVACLWPPASCSEERVLVRVYRHILRWLLALSARQLRELSRPELRRLLSFRCCSVVLQQWRGCCFRRPAEACVLFARRSTSCCLHAVSTYMFLQAPCTIAAGVQSAWRCSFSVCTREGRCGFVVKMGWEGLFVDFLLIIRMSMGNNFY